MRKIIFLDIDGVINCKTTKEKIPMLGYTGVDNTLVKRLKKNTLKKVRDAGPEEFIQ